MPAPRFSPGLLTRNDMSDPGRVPPWLTDEYAKLRQCLTDPKYPCYFGTIAEKKGQLFYTYVEDSPDHLPATVSAFLGASAASPLQRLGLALFVRPEPVERSHDFYRARFWDLLQLLHDADLQPWPGDYPRSPTDPKWEFCFDGTPMFVFAAAPSYKTRRSRNLGNCLIVLFQPRRIFHGIEGGTPAGSRARQIIRDRLMAWEGLEPHPNLGEYGDPSSQEWKQYFLPDENTPVTCECPLRIR